MTDYAISAANLAVIESSLAKINGNVAAVRDQVDVVDTRVTVVDAKVEEAKSDIASLAADFYGYVQDERRRWELEHATTRLGVLRSDLDRKYGHHATVRRKTTGILQATDLGIVRNESITSASEQLFLDCPNYWLAPALVALASWINDRKDIAEKALREALRRDSEKTSLLFGLICRRSERKDVALQWVKRYLMNQDPRKLGRETIVVLDAYASGLFANDTENMIASQLAEWLAMLSAKPDFLATQNDRWKKALKAKRKSLSGEFPFLQQYSATWPQLKDVLEGARLHQTILEYFEDIFSQPSSAEAVRKQLDEVLSSLVTEFDNEELPLRREARLCELIVEHDGDKQKAKKIMDAEVHAMEEERDFTRLLTDAAMHPEASNASASTRKFAIAYSREWIGSACADLVVENRAAVPQEIEVHFDKYSTRTRDASDEQRIISEFGQYVEQEKVAQIAEAELKGFDAVSHIVGGILLGLGALFLIIGAVSGFLLLLLGILLAIGGGVVLAGYFKKKKDADAKKTQIEQRSAQKLANGTQALRATLAEVVDYRRAYYAADVVSNQVSAFLDSINPDEYVKTLAGSVRKVG